MLDEIIEKVKEYKIAFGIVLVGALVGAFFLFKGQAATITNQHNDLTQEFASSEETSMSKKEYVEEVKTSQSSSSQMESRQLTVDVKGAVKNPGVYELEAGSRIKDVIQKAGGLLEEADGKSINLAQKVAYEAVVYVAKQGEGAVDIAAQNVGNTATSSTGTQRTNKLVNLNTATVSDLQTVSGIGAKRAQDIIDYREANGKFQSVDELKNVSGIGTKTLEKLKNYVTVS